jgi:G protein-coupled glucose receptor regulating Gpa2
LWVVFSLFVASLAFTNRSGPAYVMSGIIAYLPKKPFWYRLALTWIPSCITIFSSIAMYATVYIYVKVKFRGFSKFQRDDSSLNTSPARGPAFGQTSHNASLASPQASLTCDMTSREASGGKPSTSSTCDGPVYWASGRRPSQIRDGSEREKVDFITTSPVANSQRPPLLPFGVTAADVALEMVDKSNAETETGHGPVRSGSESTILASRNDSTAPSFNMKFTSDTAVTTGT